MSCTGVRFCSCTAWQVLQINPCFKKQQTTDFLSLGHWQQGPTTSWTGHRWKPVPNTTSTVLLICNSLACGLHSGRPIFFFFFGCTDREFVFTYLWSVLPVPDKVTIKTASFFLLAVHKKKNFTQLISPLQSTVVPSTISDQVTE